MTGYEEYEASEYALATCYLPRTRASSQVRMNGSGTPTPTGRQATKWWADGEEPIYYVVSPKVMCICVTCTGTACTAHNAASSACLASVSLRCGMQWDPLTSQPLLLLADSRQGAWWFTTCSRRGSCLLLLLLLLLLALKATLNTGVVCRK